MMKLFTDVKFIDVKYFWNVTIQFKYDIAITIPMNMVKSHKRNLG